MIQSAEELSYQSWYAWSPLDWELRPGYDVTVEPYGETAAGKRHSGSKWARARSSGRAGLGAPRDLLDTHEVLRLSFCPGAT